MAQLEKKNIVLIFKFTLVQYVSWYKKHSATLTGSSPCNAIYRYLRLWVNKRVEISLVIKVHTYTTYLRIHKTSLISDWANSLTTFSLGT